MRTKTNKLCPKCRKAYLYRCTVKAYDSAERPFQDVWYECDECDEMFEPEELENIEKRDARRTKKEK